MTVVSIKPVPLLVQVREQMGHDGELHIAQKTAFETRDAFKALWHETHETRVAVLKVLRFVVVIGRVETTLSGFLGEDESLLRLALGTEALKAVAMGGG